MNTRDLLIEIGTEELPPKALSRLAQAFHDGVLEGLARADLSHAGIKTYATPRRLALLVTALQEGQSDKQVERRGPALTAAFDDEGCPSKAATGFARSCGVEVADLETQETDKGSWLIFRVQQKGETTQTLIPDIVRQALDRLPIPKRMRWGSLTEQFVRPVHWVILLFGDEVIPANILSVDSQRETRGHRFHHPEPIYIGEPAAYAPLLESQGHVIADMADRREAIRGQVLEIAKSVQGRAVIDDDLLDEVSSMVEWPVAVLGNFEQGFLEVPAEALVSAMKNHQKYFHVVDGKGKLLPHFITVSNIESRDPDKVREGNERVIRPRLSDAEFFWNQDRKQPLANRLDSLKNVVFQNKLGTLYDKTQRTRNLAVAIATELTADTNLAGRAAELCKCDLMADMVGEFPELQGIMGRYYALHDGEDPEVAMAIDEHYMPRFSGDALPATRSGQCAALADKLDTLVGIFGIGQAPTGDKDPFALRRTSLGVLRILIELDLNLNVSELLHKAVKNYNQQNGSIIPASTAGEVMDFILARLQVYYSSQGIAHDEIDAVLCLRPEVLQDSDKRLHALTEFRRLPEAESLAAANKRISNILKKAGDSIPETWDESLLPEPAEKKLGKQLQELRVKLDPLFRQQDYAGAMKLLAGLRDNVDAFFDHVMVMTDDELLRNNRLALLNTLRNLFLRVADLSRLQGNRSDD